MTRAILAPNGRPARLEIRAQYRAVSTGSTRSSIPGYLRDANKDTSRTARREIAKQAWHWYQNSPLVRGIIERIVTYVVGSGVNPMPASLDKEWNKACLERWNELALSVEHRCGLPWNTYVAMVMRGILVGGDLLTDYIDTDDARKLLSYESHNITGAGLGQDAEYLDGVNVDATGRVVSYRIANKFDVPADRAVLHWFAERPLQYRGVSILAPALYNIHDLDDILALEKQAVKVQSSVVDVIKSASGEADTEDLIVSGGVVNPESDESRVDYYRQSFGAETKIVKSGDDYQSIAPNRPSPAWEGFVDFLAQSICLTTGFPPSVIVPVDGNGVDVRRDLATAARVIEVMQGMLTTQLARVRNSLIQHEIDNGNLDAEPVDWRRCRWQTPRVPTVDSGRDQRADVEMVGRALMTRQELHGQYGQNPDEEEDQVILEAVERKRKLEAAGLTMEEFANLLAPRSQGFLDVEQKQGGGTDKPIVQK